MGPNGDLTDKPQELTPALLVWYKNYFGDGWYCEECDNLVHYLPPREDGEIYLLCRECDGLTFSDGDGGEIDRATIEWEC